MVMCVNCWHEFDCPHGRDKEACTSFAPCDHEPGELQPKEEPMESADRIEITFKNGDTISYGKGEWDDYGYDGKAVMIKLKGAWIGIYNFDDVFCVELKAK